MLSIIEGPSYFGERNLIFETRSQFFIKTLSNSYCLEIPNEIVLSIINNNNIFRYALASSLRDKHKVFQKYRLFINAITNKHTINKLNFTKVSNEYSQLSPLLHPLCNSIHMDEQALNYVLPRLPDNITSINSVHIYEDIPEQYLPVLKEIRVDSKRAEKRYMYQVSAGRLLLLVREDEIDLIDLIAKLCMYLVEVKKIVHRLNPVPEILKQLTSYYFNKSTVKKISESKLPFKENEIAILKKHFGHHYQKNLYEIYTQKYNIDILYKETKARYFPIAAEHWINAVKSQTPKNMNQNIHIISSNRHSVISCLSAWIYKHKEELLQDLDKKQCPLLNPQDKIYFAAKQYFANHLGKLINKQRYDSYYGIKVVESGFLTGIEANIIEVSKLTKSHDPLITLPNSGANDIIINIDYAYGKQAAIIMKQLILMFGEQIKSISVFGKCGGLYGKRGDIIIPENIIDFHNDELCPILNQKLTPKDIPMTNNNVITQGNLLTVASTVLQDKSLLNYYKNLWGVVGLEMEGNYYLSEIINAVNLQLLCSDIQLNFAYYISDLPLESNQNLAENLSEEVGIPAVYNITRAILNKILN